MSVRLRTEATHILTMYKRDIGDLVLCYVARMLPIESLSIVCGVYKARRAFQNPSCPWWWLLLREVCIFIFYKRNPLFRRWVPSNPMAVIEMKFIVGHGVHKYASSASSLGLGVQLSGQLLSDTESLVTSSGEILMGN